MDEEFWIRSAAADPYVDDAEKRAYKRDVEDLYKRELCHIHARDLADTYGIPLPRLARRCYGRPKVNDDAHEQGGGNRQRPSNTVPDVTPMSSVGQENRSEAANPGATGWRPAPFPHLRAPAGEGRRRRT